MHASLSRPSPLLPRALRRAFSLVELLVVLVLLGVMMAVAVPFMAHSFSNAHTKVLQQELTTQGEAAITFHDGSGQWPPVIQLPPTQDKHGTHVNPISITVHPNGDAVCLDGSYAGLSDHYYFSSVTTGALQRGTHPGTCAQPTTQRATAPTKSAPESTPAKSAKPFNWHPVTLIIEGLVGLIVLVGGGLIGWAVLDQRRNRRRLAATNKASAATDTEIPVDVAPEDPTS